MSADDVHVASIVRNWNQRMWLAAERGLRVYFDELFQQNELPLARRVRHLLGVCLSYQGKLTQALDCFLSVLRTPVRDPRLFDDADSAACWWLGDTYAMLNMRKEAWLAYSLAEKSPMFRLRSSGTLRWAIAAERKCVMETLPASDFQTIWAQQVRNPELYKGSILHASVVPQAVALVCLRGTPDDLDTRNFLLQKQNRAQCLLNSSKEHTELAWCNNPSPERLHPTSLKANTGWPMPFDPFFTMANVQQGRLQGQSCDLLEMNSQQELASRRGGRFRKPLSALENFDFTTDSLPTLVRSLRDALQSLDIRSVEYATDKKMGFLCGYPQITRGVATTYYFSLTVARSAKGAGRFGVRIAPDGVCSARLVGVYDSLEYEKGVPLSEKSNVRKMLSDCLESGERARSIVAASGPAAGRRLSTASIRSSVSSLAPMLPKNGSAGRPGFTSSLFGGIGGRPYEIQERV